MVISSNYNDKINGNVTRYIYSATGEKLRVVYQTAVPNITVAIGSTRELMPSEILYTDLIRPVYINSKYSKHSIETFIKKFGG